MDERDLDHVGIAVHSLDQAIPTWTSIIGASPHGRETVDSQGAEIVFIGEGRGRVELLAPTRTDSPITRFLDRRGPGMHHLCYRVADLSAALAESIAAGFEPIDPEPRPGAHGRLVIFLHPRGADGVLIELAQDAAPPVTDTPAVPRE